MPYSSVHPGYRFSAPGAYLTLTTCTPEYSSAYRLVVWAVLRSTQPNTEAHRRPLSVVSRAGSRPALL